MGMLIQCLLKNREQLWISNILDEIWEISVTISWNRFGHIDMGFSFLP